MWFLYVCVFQFLCVDAELIYLGDEKSRETSVDVCGCSSG